MNKNCRLQNGGLSFLTGNQSIQKLSQQKKAAHSSINAIIESNDYIIFD